MTFRSRVLIAMLAAALVPLVLFAAGVRRELGERVQVAHDRRVAALTSVIERDLGREAAAIGERIHVLARALPDDDRIRMALVGGADANRRPLLDYAARAMGLAGLDVLQLHDSAGRILSSGQFRNDFGRLEPELPEGIDAHRDTVLLARVRTPEGPMLALVRRASVRIGGESYVLVGGVRADRHLLDRFAAGADLGVDLLLPDDTTFAVPALAGDADAVVAELAIPVLGIGAPSAQAAADAKLRISRRGDELAEVRRSIDRWFAAAALLVAGAAIALGAWLAARLSRPLADLAAATGAISLSGPDVSPPIERDDEIGLLARRLTSMSRRLRSSAEALREAERRATVGEIARQVNHDIKNGLVPIRNVLRHLGEVQEREPAQLPAIFAERRHTLDASVGYLDALARRYARLAPRSERAPIDLAMLAAEVVQAACAGGADVRLEMGRWLPPVQVDALALRRMLDNVVRNAVESLTSGDDSVTMRLDPERGGVRIAVSDTGRGMSQDELARAFDDFHTTKPNGTGLGLSVVRRLASDLGATVHVASATGKGTTVTVTLLLQEPNSHVRSARPHPRFPIPDSRFPTQ